MGPENQLILDTLGLVWWLKVGVQVFIAAQCIGAVTAIFVLAINATNGQRFNE